MAASSPFKNQKGVYRILFKNETEKENDDGKMSKLILKEFKARMMEARERWNFDFEKEIPLEGEWVWLKSGDESHNGCKEEEDVCDSTTGDDEK